MSSFAFAGLGSRLYLQTLNPASAPVPKTISGISRTNPVVVSAAAHGVLDGMLVTLSGVTGMPEISGTYYASNVSAGSLSLVSLDGQPVNASNFGTYVSGGTLTAMSYLPVTEARKLNFADAQTPEIDVTTLASSSKEYLIGLQDAGEFSMEMNYVPFDPAMLEMRQAKSDARVRAMRIDFPDGSTFAFRGFVKAVPFQTDYQSAVTGSATIKMTGVTLWMP